jgi:hypothetical protein
VRSAGVRNLAVMDTRQECITLVAKLETDAGKQYSTRGYINIYASGNVRVIIYILKKVRVLLCTVLQTRKHHLL